MSDDIVQPNGLRALVHATIFTPSPFGRYLQPPARRQRHENVVLFSTGEQEPDVNELTVVGPIEHGRAFALADAFFPAGTRYSVTVELEAAPDMDRVLQSRGWTLDEEEPALVLRPLPPEMPTPLPDLAIRMVSTEAELADFATLWPRVRRWVPSLAAATDPDVALCLAYLDGRAVATSRVAVMGEVMEITTVTTLPEYRRRGLGTALTWAAIDAGRARGATAAVLTASEMGFPVYRKMGFEVVCTYRTYVPPA